MLTSDFDYNLPAELIAQTPASPRDCSRLMVVDKMQKKISHKHFQDITKYISNNDLVVWNNSKVFKARLKGTIMLDESSDDISDKREQRMKLSDMILNAPEVEIFLLRPAENFGVWSVLAKPAKKLRLGMKIVFAHDFFCSVLLKQDDGTLLVEFTEDDMSIRAKANKYGEVPTPPYIKKPIAGIGSCLEDDYQTIYAREEGSVAAPTAGFHFTPKLVEQLKVKGVEFAEITLHVGLGTFQPIKTDNTDDHKMHSEWVSLTSSNADLINQAKKDGRRVIAVGTTTARTLEGVASLSAGLPALSPYTGDINIFIIPGYKFKIIDALITNFHLPKSTLLMMISAFIGSEKFTLDCYQKAIKANYRFYSFGDAMLIK
ncbi:MAG: tRNA preQ1(34) S-adenosylmethionine ribosyltransferase-isomerase QueA [bacterium]